MLTLKTDVLVVGGGGAAARAAFEAYTLGADVTLAVKGSFNAIGTRGSGATASGMSPFGLFATPGWNGPLSAAEKKFKNMIGLPLDKAFSNILQVGLGMADPKLAKIIVENAIDTRARLLELCSTFGEFGMRSHGVPIMAALGSKIQKSGINLLEGTMIIDLVVQENECLGAIAVEEETGEIFHIEAGATVVATGGDANLYLLNMNPSCNTADGYAMGCRAGAELMNMEFRQIFLGTVYPTRNMLIRTLPPYVKLTNEDGEEFLENYLPEGSPIEECLSQRNERNPFSTRDPLSKYVDIAILNEVKAGRGTDNLGIYLDRSNPQNPPIEPKRHQFYVYRGIDFSKGPVEVGVCHHSSLGGFKIGEQSETSIARLYAAGEVAAGPHGADRIGGGMLLASQVFGAISGKKAAEEALKANTPPADRKVINQVVREIDQIKNSNGKLKPGEIKLMLQKKAYFDLLVEKDRVSLERFISEVKNIEEELVPDAAVSTPGDLVDALELRNLLLTARVEAAACLEREESRGPHYRKDFPERNDQEWLKGIVIKMVDDSLVIDRVVIDSRWNDRGDETIGGYWA